MSEITQEQFDKAMKDKNDFAKTQEEVQKRQLAIADYKTSHEYNRINQVKRNDELSKSIDFGQMTQDKVERIQKENSDYMEAARNMLSFINKSFDNVVPFFRKNLIVIGGKTGEGKSTTTANIIRSTIMQKNPVTGKLGRVLVITNEEKSEDVYNRVTCQSKGWAYTNHNKFSEEQKSTLHDYIKILSRVLTVVDDNFGSTDDSHLSGMTTTLEGIRNIFDNLIANQEWYDCVIIDYYQKINTSTKNPTLKGFDVLDLVANMLDNYKNSYPAPIVVMAQVQPPDKDSKTPFEIRMKGRKSICEKATLCMEMIADRQNLRTQWVVHKSRFTDSVGQEFFTGYDHGRFVDYDEKFCRKVNERNERKMFAETVGKHVFKDKNKEEKNEKSGTD